MCVSVCFSKMTYCLWSWPQNSVCILVFPIIVVFTCLFVSFVIVVFTCLSVL